MYFRVDMNQTIASGHIMRCIAIADAFREYKEESTFILSDDQAKEFLENRGYQTIVLESKWDEMESELDKLLFIIKEKNIKEILIDSYFVTKAYLEKLRKQVHTIYVDDLDSMIYPVDLLICYSRYKNKQAYLSKYKNQNTKVLFGTKYIPLRKEFWNLDKKEHLTNERKKVLITTGGMDSQNMAWKITNEVYKRRENDFVIVSGKQNLNYKKLLELEKNYENIHVLSNVENMAELMETMDCAISATGTTVFELCACKIPSICYVAADNQVELASYMSKTGAMIYVGDVRKSSNCVIKYMKNTLDSILYNEEKRKKMINAMGEMIKEVGGKEIVCEIRKKFSTNNLSGENR